MVREYQPRRFFRHAPNLMLQRYFGLHDVLSNVGFGSLTETQVEPIYEAWLALPDDVRKEMEQDFQAIDELATEGGSRAILDEALWHGEDLAEQFAAHSSFHERAFWTFLERPQYWQGAIAFHHADVVPVSYWRKRKNLPRKPASVDAASIRQLEQSLSSYFHKTQGRGENCRVDCYKRNDLDYFFAYPEDYAQANVEWEGKEFIFRRRHPAFEIIFVYSQNDGTLDICLTGYRKTMPDLQEIFANTILKSELGPDERDERVYDLDPMRSRQFQFVYDPESGISDVAVRKLRLTVYGTGERITLEADPTYGKHAVFDLLDKVAKGIPLSQMVVTQVGVKVTFAIDPSSKRIRTRSFEISWPNSSSLKHDGRDLTLRKMLADSGIEPRQPAKNRGAPA